MVDTSLKTYILFVHGCTESSSLWWPFSGCGEWGLLLDAVQQLVLAVASLLQSTGSRVRGLGSRGTQISSPCSMWNLPLFPAMAGRFSTVGPRGKSILLP